MKRLVIATAFVLAAWLLPAGTSGVEPLRDSRAPAFAPVVTAAPTEVVIPVPPAPTGATQTPGGEGIASWMPEVYGRDYAALPVGPGYRFVVCGAGGCWESVSNDAGPDRAMQREGRVIDLAVVRWEQVCGVDRKFGLCPVTVTIVGRAK